MEIPAKVMIHNTILGVKGQAGRLIAVNDAGYYEVHLKLGAAEHTVLLPIGETVLICQDPNPAIDAMLEVER